MLAYSNSCSPLLTLPIPQEPSVCPECLDNDIRHGRHHDETGLITRDAVCEGCALNWTENFVFTAAKSVGWTLKEEPNCCPCCQSEELEVSGVQSHDNRLKRSMSCLSCETEWEEFYSFSHISMDL